MILCFISVSPGVVGSLIFQCISQAMSAGTSSSAEEAVDRVEGAGIYFLRKTLKTIS